MLNFEYTSSSRVAPQNAQNASQAQDQTKTPDRQPLHHQQQQQQYNNNYYAANNKLQSQSDCCNGNNIVDSSNQQQHHHHHHQQRSLSGGGHHQQQHQNQQRSSMNNSGNFGMQVAGMQPPRFHPPPSQQQQSSYFPPRGGTGDTGNDSFASSFKPNSGGGHHSYNAAQNAAGRPFSNHSGNLGGAEPAGGANSVDYLAVSSSTTTPNMMLLDEHSHHHHQHHQHHHHQPQYQYQYRQRAGSCFSSGNTVDNQHGGTNGNNTWMKHPTNHYQNNNSNQQQQLGFELFSNGRRDSYSNERQMVVGDNLSTGGYNHHPQSQPHQYTHQQSFPGQQLSSSQYPAGGSSNHYSQHPHQNNSNNMTHHQHQRMQQLSRQYSSGSGTSGNHHSHHLHQPGAAASFYHQGQPTNQSTQLSNLFSNQKHHHAQMDRLEDDDQRSPERRPPKTATSGDGLNYDQHPLSRSPTGGDGFVMPPPQMGSPDRRETFGRVRPGSGGYQINMIGGSSTTMPQHNSHQHRNHHNNASSSYGSNNNNNNNGEQQQRGQQQNSQQQNTTSSKLAEILQKSRRSNHHNEWTPNHRSHHHHNQQYNHFNQSSVSNQQHAHNHANRRHHPVATDTSSTSAATMTSYLMPTKQSSAPNRDKIQQQSQSQTQKTRKKTKTVLDQREHFKIRPARCFLGDGSVGGSIKFHYSQNTLSWQQAIGCIEDLGVDMSTHWQAFESQQQTQPNATSVLHTDQNGMNNEPVGVGLGNFKNVAPGGSTTFSGSGSGVYDFDEPVVAPGNFRQAARSDGFKNWSGAGSNNGQQPAGSSAQAKRASFGRNGQKAAIQTDFYQVRKGSAATNSLLMEGGAESETAVESGSGVLHPGDLRGSSHALKPQCHTQNNFFQPSKKSGMQKNLREDENVSNNDEDDAFHEVQKNDLLENLSYQKSPSGASRLQKHATNTNQQKQQTSKKQGIISEQAETEAIQTLMSLRYSDLIYLLNILKLQRSKNAEQVKFGRTSADVNASDAREQWVTDLQLALSVAISAEDRDTKDTNMIARVLIEKVEAACSNDSSINPLLNSILQPNDGQALHCDLKYEHFIGPLVILCAVNNLLRAQGNNTGEAECISTIKLCFDQFERYYAKAVTTAASAASQRRSNSMSGSTFPAARMDSFEVEADTFRNFTVSLWRFIERENLPCKADLHQALESITLNKVQSNFLIFPPQGSQLILSQLTRLFNSGGSSATNHTNSSKKQDQADLFAVTLGAPQKTAAGHLYTGAAGTSENLLLDSRMSSKANAQMAANSPRGGALGQAESGGAKKCIKHGITLCPCGTNNAANIEGSNTKPNGASKPQFTLQPQITTTATTTTAAVAAERRQHSMVDFSASSNRRGLKTQDSNSMNQPAGGATSGGDYVMVTGGDLYRPFSTIISGRSEAESVRPSMTHFGPGGKTANQPMSLELEHKRSLPSQSQQQSQNPTTLTKSVQKPKKGILKQSSSYLDSQTKPPNRKAGGAGTTTQPTSTQPSPYMAMKKLKGASKLVGAGGIGNPSPRGSTTSTTSKKQHQNSSSMRQYDSQRNLLHRLGGGVEGEPPKFSHQATNGSNCKSTTVTGSIFSPKAGSASTTVGSKRPGQQTSKTNGNRLNAVNNASNQIQLSSLQSILRAPGAGAAGSSSNNNYSSNSGYMVSQQQTGSDSGAGTSSTAATNQAASNLVANSMKYLRTPAASSVHHHHHQQQQVHAQHQGHHQDVQKTTSSLLNTSTHSSNVLLQAQNMQNRNDSFGVHSSYSNTNHHNHHHHNHNNHNQQMQQLQNSYAGVSSTVTSQNHSGMVVGGGSTHHNPHNGNNSNQYKISTLQYRQNGSSQQQQQSNNQQQNSSSSQRIQQLMSPQSNIANHPAIANTLPRNSSRDNILRGSAHQSPQRTTTTGLIQQQERVLMTGSSAARRSNSHQGVGVGALGSGSHPSSLLQTSSFQNGSLSGAAGGTNIGGGGVNYPHPRLLNHSSARKSSQGNHNHQNNPIHHGSFGGSATQNASHALHHSYTASESSKAMIGVGGGHRGGAGGIAHTDFNQVSQFSLSSSLKEQQTPVAPQSTSQVLGGDSDYNTTTSNTNGNHRRRLQY